MSELTRIDALTDYTGCPVSIREKGSSDSGPEVSIHISKKIGWTAEDLTELAALLKEAAKRMFGG